MKSSREVAEGSQKSSKRVPKKAEAAFFRSSRKQEGPQGQGFLPGSNQEFWEINSTLIIKA